MSKKMLFFVVLLPVFFTAQAMEQKERARFLACAPKTLIWGTLRVKKQELLRDCRLLEKKMRRAQYLARAGCCITHRMRSLRSKLRRLAKNTERFKKRVAEEKTSPDSCF